MLLLKSMTGKLSYKEEISWMFCSQLSVQAVGKNLRLCRALLAISGSLAT